MMSQCQCCLNSSRILMSASPLASFGSSKKCQGKNVNSEITWILELSPLRFLRLLWNLCLRFCLRKMLRDARKIKKLLWPKIRLYVSHSRSMRETLRRRGSVLWIWMISMTRWCTSSERGTSHGRSWSPDSEWWWKEMNMKESKESGKMLKFHSKTPSCLQGCKLT